MMIDLQILKGCELHVHTGGCLAADDLLAMGQAHYEAVDWGMFVEKYQAAYGERLDPHHLYREAMRSEAGAARFRRTVTFHEEDGGDFARFQAKFYFLTCLTRYWRYEMQQPEAFGRLVLQRHQQEGLDYVEYRAMYADVVERPEGFFVFHGENGRLIQNANNEQFTARYLVSLPREAPLLSYELLQRFFDEQPGLVPLVVGVDFCGMEEGMPPALMHDFFARLHADNAARPERALAVAYHVGESFFDKSLESAVRWCHEVAELGARRLGHAIALGLDPAVAVSRRPQAHEVELVSERLAQIAYDLVHREGLAVYGVVVDEVALAREQARLGRMDGGMVVKRPYTPQRLAEIRRRQDFVLDRLVELDVVIESCPTSNLRIGGVPSPEHHPIHRFLASSVNLVISADDPGVFDSPLADEVEWVLQHSDYDAAQLVARLGDPRRFRFEGKRPFVYT